jgi:hypothetical protein
VPTVSVTLGSEAMNNISYSVKRAGLRGVLVIAAGTAIAALLFHTSYRAITGLKFPGLPVRNASTPHFTESISPDGRYRVHLEGGKSSRVQLSVFPTTGPIDTAETAEYVVLDTNSDASVYYVWETPTDLVVYCPLCTPIRVARQRTRLGDLRIKYKFPSPTVDESTAVVEVPPTLPADEQKQYLDKVHRLREEHPYHF